MPVGYCACSKVHSGQVPLIIGRALNPWQGAGILIKPATAGFTEVAMKAVQEHPNHWYSARNMAKPVNFYCAAPEAKAVYLVGDFNDWDPTSLPMERRVDGWWFLQVPLPHGHHRYRFLVDGQPVLDPQATGAARNEAKEEVSLVAVS